MRRAMVIIRVPIFIIFCGADGITAVFAYANIALAKIELLIDFRIQLPHGMNQSSVAVRLRRLPATQ